MRAPPQEIPIQVARTPHQLRDIMSQTLDLHVLFRGYINEDSLDDDEPDFADFDTKAFGLQSDLDRLEPNRDPRLETEYIGNNGEFELKFVFLTTWLDRDADVEDYLDRVQNEIENGLDVIVTEREKLGYMRRQ